MAKISDAMWRRLSTAIKKRSNCVYCMRIILWPHASHTYHDDVIKWNHFPRYWPFMRGIHRWIPSTKASDAELWLFFFICAWINDWVNNREAGDLRRHRTHYDINVMIFVWKYNIRNTNKATARLLQYIRLICIRFGIIENILSSPDKSCYQLRLFSQAYITGTKVIRPITQLKITQDMGYIANQHKTQPNVNRRHAVWLYYRIWYWGKIHVEHWRVCVGNNKCNWVKGKGRNFTFC